MAGGTVGVAYNQCLSASGGDGGPYTYALDSGSVPAGTSLTSGCVTGTPTTATTYNFAVTANDGTDTSVAKSLSIIIGANPPTITTLTLPNGIVDTGYSTQACASGGTPAYTFTVSVGSLPAGLTLTTGSPCATVSGTPTTASTTSFTLQISDSLSQTDSQAYTVVVVPAIQNVELSVVVAVGSNAANVVFGGSGFGSGTACIVQLLQSDIVVKENAEVLRLAKQRSTFSGLSPLTTYGAVVSCPQSTTQTPVFFTTLALEATAPVTVPIVLKPPSIHPTVTQVTLDWGVDSVAENTVTQSCASGCTINLSLSAGIYVVRHIWKNVGGTALATSGGRELIVP
jgi:hypothetical protein